MVTSGPAQSSAKRRELGRVRLDVWLQQAEADALEAWRAERGLTKVEAMAEMIREACGLPARTK